MKKSISIVVPCYNVENTIFNTIKAIKTSIGKCCDGWDWEIVAVNDGSTDSTKIILSNISNITLINHERNKSLSSARNTGIYHSVGNYIAFIDADIEVSDGWFCDMLLELTMSPNIIGLTGTLRPKNLDNSPLNQYLFSRYRGHQKPSKNTCLNYKSFVFSNTIIDKAVLDKVGFFDERLEHYGGEDTELAIRIHKLYPFGMKKSSSISYHITDKSLSDYLLNMYEYGRFNFPLIIRKHPNYKNDLGYFLCSPLFTILFFNFIVEKAVFALFKAIQHPLMIKFFVISSFVKGARRGIKR